MKLKISFSNSKLGDKIPSLSFPAGKTCRTSAPCKTSCYALKGNFRRNNVKENLKNNLDYYLKDYKNFKKDLINFINNEDVVFKFFRWFVSGDMVNYKMLLLIVEVAKTCKNTNFLVFTKKFEYVNLYLSLGHKIPKNLNIIFSGWDCSFSVENPYNLPVAYVNFKDQTKNSKNISDYAIPCVGSCRSCKGCWSLKKGQQVIFNEH